MLELPPDIENGLREKAARNGQDVTDYLRQILGEHGDGGERHELAGNADRPRESDPAYLLSLPKAARDRIMEAQAALAAPLYEADLALPVAERELTAFTALDGDPVLENYHAG
jgi:hypothetical protein